MSIQEHLNKIRNAVYGHEVRESIAKGIETAYDDASENGNANMEVKVARGTHPNLRSRLEEVDNKQQQNTAQLAQKATKDEVDNLKTMKANITYVESKVAQIASGSPKRTFADLTALQTAFPNGDENNYVLQSDGKIYNWSGTSWVDTGILYQSTGFANNSISNVKLKGVIGSLGKNQFNKYDVIHGQYIDGNGNLQAGSTESGLDSLSNYIAVEPSTAYSRGGRLIVVYFDESLNQIGLSAYGTSVVSTPESCSFVRLSFRSEELETIQFEKGATPTPYEPWKFTIEGLDRGVKTEQIDDKAITADKLADEAITYEKIAGLIKGAGKNLFNKEDYEPGLYIDGFGNLKTGSSATGLDSLSGFIKVSPNTTYRPSHQLITVYYDSNFQQIGFNPYKDEAVTSPNNCEYVKLSFRSVDVETLQFERGSTKTDYEPWKFTIDKLTVFGATGGGNDYSPEITELQTKMQATQRRMMLDPSYVRPMLENVAERVNELRNENTYTFGFITDTHTTGSILHHHSTIAEASKYVHMDFICHGGDILDGMYNRNTELKYLLRAQNLLNESITPIILCKGDHDDANFYARANENLTTDYINNLDLYNRSNKFYEDSFVVGSKERMYFHRDSEEFKIRTIFMNTNDIPETDTDGVRDYNAFNYSCYSNEQLNWLAHTALNFSDKDNPSEWGVIIMGHIVAMPYVPNFPVVKGILDAFTSGGSYVDAKAEVMNGDAVATPNRVPDGGFKLDPNFGYDVDVDFSTQGAGEFITFIGGHGHFDLSSTETDYLAIRTLNASLSQVNANAPKKTLYTNTETAWDIFTIDRGKRKIYTTRFGAGVDREFSY